MLLPRVYEFTADAVPSTNAEFADSAKAASAPTLHVPLHLPASTPLFHQTSPPIIHPPSLPHCQGRELLELQHPRGFRGRYGHPDFPLCGDKTASVQLWPEDLRVRFDRSFEETESERSRLRYVSPKPIDLEDLTFSSAQGKYPQVAAFGTWPPSFIAPNSIQDRQLGSIMSGENAQSVPLPLSKVASPLQTPGSTRNNTPAAAAGTMPENPKTSLSFAIGSVTSPTPAAHSSAGQATPGSSQSKGNEAIQPTLKSTQTPLEPSPKDVNAPTHLEAYFIRPSCEDLHSSAVEWTYKTDHLPLDDEAIGAHIHKLGDDHSIIDDICELHPEQLRLIKIRAKHRQGKLISAQLGKPIDMVTKMGTFPVRGVVFLIRTSKAEEEDEDVQKSDLNGNKMNSSLFSDSARRPPFNPATGDGTANRIAPPAPASGLFGRSSTLTSSAGPHITAALLSGSGTFAANPTPASGFDATNPRTSSISAFGNNALQSGVGVPWTNPASTSGFDSFVSKPSLPTTGLFAHRTTPTPTTGLFARKTTPPPTTGVFGRKASPPPSVLLYSQLLKENGEICTHLEHSYNNTMEHFQTIIPLLSKDVSFEELRQVDTEAGRKGPGEEKGVVYPWDMEKQGAASRFLGQATPKSSASWSGTSTAPAAGSGGLFGGVAQNQGAKVPFGSAQTSSVLSGGLFASNNSSSSGGLFGTAPPSSTAGGLFGGSSTDRESKDPQAIPSASSGGLFGSNAAQEKPSKTGGLFGNVAAQETPSSTGGPSGNVAAQQKPSTTGGLFGSDAARQKPSTTGGLFGSNAAQQNSSTTGGLFGSKAAKQNSSTGGLFGSKAAKQNSSTTGGLFGSNAAQEKPSSTGSLFGDFAGQEKPSTTSGLFRAPRSAPYTLSGTELFGKTTVQSQPAGSSDLFAAALSGPRSNVEKPKSSLFAGTDGASKNQSVGEASPSISESATIPTSSLPTREQERSSDVTVGSKATKEEEDCKDVKEEEEDEEEDEEDFKEEEKDFKKEEEDVKEKGEDVKKEEEDFEKEEEDIEEEEGTFRKKKRMD